MEEMMERIHIFGASGSGATSLSRLLAIRLNYRHFDIDDYFWLPTEPPFQKIREEKERRLLLMRDIESNRRWVISGSLCGWGDAAIPLFDLVVFLYVPKEVRLRRLRDREIARFGKTRLDPGGVMHEQHRQFMNWAAAYDDGGLDSRSLQLHRQWLRKITCDVLRFEGDQPIERQLKTILTKITD